MRAGISARYRRIFRTFFCSLAYCWMGSWEPANNLSQVSRVPVPKRALAPLCKSATVVITLLAGAQADAKECPPGHAANEQEDWQGLANNARQNADWYVVDRGAPEATPTLGEVSVVYQDDGEYEGQYLVIIKQLSHPKYLFMVLRPRFDFCSDISSIDDAKPDLFEVIFANLDGRKF